MVAPEIVVFETMVLPDRFVKFPLVPLKVFALIVPLSVSLPVIVKVPTVTVVPDIEFALRVVPVDVPKPMIAMEAEFPDMFVPEIRALETLVENCAVVPLRVKMVADVPENIEGTDCNALAARPEVVAITEY